MSCRPCERQQEVHTWQMPMPTSKSPLRSRTVCLQSSVRTMNATRDQAEAEHPSLPGFPPSKGPTCQNLDTREHGQAVSNITIEAGYTNNKKTVVKGSRIPNAGYGLFAAEATKKGRVIGGMFFPVDLADNLRIYWRGIGYQ